MRKISPFKDKIKDKEKDKRMYETSLVRSL